jgi:hypothetical protein
MLEQFSNVMLPFFHGCCRSTFSLPWHLNISINNFHFVELMSYLLKRWYISLLSWMQIFFGVYESDGNCHKICRKLVLASDEWCTFFFVFVSFGYYIINTVSSSSSCDVDEIYCTMLVSLCGLSVIPYKGTILYRFLLN